jgi:hypothetical protein
LKRIGIQCCRPASSSSTHSDSSELRLQGLAGLGHDTSKRRLDSRLSESSPWQRRRDYPCGVSCVTVTVITVQVHRGRSRRHRGRQTTVTSRTGRAGTGEPSRRHRAVEARDPQSTLAGQAALTLARALAALALQLGLALRLALPGSEMPSVTRTAASPGPGRRGVSGFKSRDGDDS